MKSSSALLSLGWSLALASTASATPVPGDRLAGAAIFQDRCAICHVPQGGGQGPSLTLVIDRAAGSVKGFNYTAALKASGLTWTATTLDVFLSNPGKAVPGTAMPIRVSDFRQRADLIAYLTEHK